MPYTPRLRCHMKRLKHTLVACALLICFMATIILQTLILSHAFRVHEYKSAGGCCAACVQIQHAQNLFKRLIPAVSAAICTWISIFAAIAALKPICYPLAFLSLIALKMRMND